MKHSTLIILSVIGLFFTSCAVVKQDMVGVKRKFGKIKTRTLEPGLYAVNPFTTTMLTIPSRTINMELRLNLPSKEGLTISSEISILYRIKKEAAAEILRKVGSRYESTLILPVFRSASADVCARFFAKDMHSGERAVIENKIQERMQELLDKRGFVIESVLLKSISLPTRISQAIEQKLAAEQDAMRMQFVLQREQQEAKRKRIEAEGIRDYQKIISNGLTKEVIQMRSIEVMRELVKSNNSKVIITNGKTPVFLNGNK
ncbi:spfh domain, band 7 family protein [marine bacterium AO1-C]|nr:spfh domain, band 7 family protein [marine bacterium AO1-C]